MVGIANPFFARWGCFVKLVKSPTLAGLVTAILIALTSQPSAQELRYRWRDGQQYAYTFTIKAEIGDKVQEIKGHSLYTARSAHGAGPEEEAGESTGTGFVVKSNGYLMTCAHVVEDAARIMVKLGDKEYVGRVVATDEKNDLALVKIAAKDLPTLPLGDSDKVELAQDVRAVGFPLSDVLGSSIKITSGTISGIVESDEKKLLQVDAPINPGNSGGPLVNDRGEVIGVASAKLAGRDVSSVGFAVPSNLVRKLLETKGVEFGTTGAAERLAGPDLARRVTPSVAYFEVTADPAAAADRFHLNFTGAREVWIRSAGRAAEKVEDESVEEGKVLIDTEGRVIEVTGGDDLPFALGSQAAIGIERLSGDDDKTWGTEAATILAGVLPGSRSAIPGVREPVRTAVAYPAIEQTTYEIVGDAAGGTVPIKKTYEFKTLHKPGEKPLVEMSGKGTISFDRAGGVVRGLRFKGQVDIRDGARVTEIPITYNYDRVDPASLGGGIASPGGSRPTSPHRLPRMVPGDRLAVPTGAKRDEVEALLTRVFGADIEKARTSPAKLALAEKLLETANSEADATQRFVLLNRARSLAIAAGDLKATLKVVGQMVRGFRIDPASAEQATISAVAAKASTPSQHQQVASMAKELMEEAIATDRLDAAASFGVIALKAARESRNSELAKWIVKRGSELREMRAARALVKSYIETLEKNPDDATANRIVGKYHCFIKRDWTRGLPMLAQSDDTEFKPVAAADLRNPASGADCKKLADQWWKLVVSSPDNIKDGVRERALHWYLAAQEDLTGLNRAAVDQILEENAEFLPKDAPAIAGGGNSGDHSGSGDPLMDHIAAAVAKKKTLKSTAFAARTARGRRPIGCGTTDKTPTTEHRRQSSPRQAGSSRRPGVANTSGRRAKTQTVLVRARVLNQQTRSETTRAARDILCRAPPKPPPARSQWQRRRTQSGSTSATPSPPPRSSQ